MKTLHEIAGTYYLISPYHKNKKKLPFNIETDGYVSTVEYKGYKAYLVTGYYKLEVLLSIIDSNIISEGKAEFPKYMKRKTDY